MTDVKNATERLRELLDERGTHYVGSYDMTRWVNENGCVCRAYTRPGHLTVDVAIMDVSPEQAIAATLGRGTCKDVCADVSEFTCGACGFNCELASWISLFDGDDGRHRHHYHGTPNFCPNCGRKVVDE